jgi:23S rRNA pseudouridine1911/1915/1917 synthase
LKLNNKIIIDPSYTVKENDICILKIPDAVEAKPAGEKIDLDIIYEDSDLIVVNKQKGLVVHPAPGNPNKTLVNALINHCGNSLSGIGGEKRPGIIHRLDKDTSGLLVVAKNDRSHNGLASQFKNHGKDGKLMRAYKAIAWGIPTFSSGKISTFIGRSDRNRKKMMVFNDEKYKSKEAITHWKVLKKNDENNITLIECNLETGRTHQIRVHLDHISHPVLGDPLYGHGYKTRVNKLRSAMKTLVEKHGNTQALHAYKLGFEHPITNKNLIFETDPPETMKKIIESF